MYRKNLKTSCFQAPVVLILVGITVALLLAGGGAPVKADSSTVSAATDSTGTSSTVRVPEPVTMLNGDTVATPDSTAQTESLFTDTAAEIRRDDQNKKALPLSVGKKKGGATKQNGRKRAGSARLHKARKLMSALSAIAGLAKNKSSGLIAPFTGLRRHFKKILFLVCSIILVLITIHFYQNFRERGRFMTTTRLSIMDKEVQRACRYIEEHYSDPELDLKGICSALVTGGAFLEALFMKELGLSIEDFITQVRINRAKIALRRDPELPVDTLARSVGYMDQDDFLERFEAITGSGWQSYRDALEKGSDAAA